MACRSSCGYVHEISRSALLLLSAMRVDVWSTGNARIALTPRSRESLDFMGWSCTWHNERPTSSRPMQNLRCAICNRQQTMRSALFDSFLFPLAMSNPLSDEQSLANTWPTPRE
eukprot:1934847-Amphidinium_carterae.1